MCIQKKKKRKMLLKPLVFLVSEVQLEFLAYSQEAFKLDREETLLFILQFGRGDLDTNSGKSVNTSELQS